MRNGTLSRLPLLMTFFAAAAQSLMAGNGDAVRTFPKWEEQPLHELVNRTRVNPATDLAGCGVNCSAAELAPTCYTAVNPLPWNFGLNQSSRFQSFTMSKVTMPGHDTPFVVRSDIASVYPDLCDGSQSWASSGPGS